MDSDDLLHYLLKQDRKIILLDGYSGCGKTAILKQLMPAASCPVFLFSYRDIMNEMWNEILQTEEIVYLRDGLKKVLSEAEDKFIFHSDYVTFALAIGITVVGYDVNVQVQNVGGNVGEWFSMSQEAITDVLCYLSECCEKYPVR